MERLIDLFTPTTFSFYGYIVAIVCPIGGITFSAITGSLRDKERRNFHCNVGSKIAFDKNFVRASCFDQYDQQYNLPLPLYGFVLFSFFILTLISIVYSWCCVKSRVEEVEQACKIDAENPRPRQRFTTKRVFNCYLAQLLVRLILGIVFVVLQNFVLYPSGFPTSFVCEMKLEKSKVPETNMTFSNSSFIDCRNSMGSDKDVWALRVWIVNMILACVVAGEIIYLIRRACRDKTFMNDSEFCQRHLFNRRKTSSRMDEYRERQHRRIIEDTQVLDPLIPPSPGENEGCKNLDDVYVNLIIHTGRSRPNLDMERMDKLRILEEYVKSPVDSIRINKLEELFLPNKDSSDPRKVLVVGCPGIGKTLLCKKLLRELSKGDMLKDEPRTFLHLFLFHFRNFNSDEMKSMSLQTLLSHGKYSEGTVDEEVFQFILEHPDKILLVFDGLDELKDHQKCMEEEEKHAGNGAADVMPFGALYVKLVKGKILKGATVLTTTRPYAIDSIRGLQFHRTVEILGFSTEKVQEYCTNFFHDDKGAMERVWQHVESNINLLYLCYIPVNCFIVCSLLEKIIEFATGSLEGVALPTTLTQIYEGALRLFIFKHHPEYQGKPLTRHDLASNVKFSRAVEETLSKLEALSFKGIEERRLVFELEEVQGMENCGLLNRMRDIENAPFTYKAQYCFIHLTMQEFVAARGIAKRNPRDLLEFICSKFEDDKWHLVLQFVSGLLRGKVMKVNKIFAKNLQDSLLISDLRRKRMALLMMKCLYEANDISSVKTAAAELKSNRQFTNCIELHFLGLNPVDITAVVYFFKHIDNLECLDISYNLLGDGGCSELSKLITVGGPRKLYLIDCLIGDQGLIKILEAMKTAEKCNLSVLDLKKNYDISSKGHSYLCDTLIDQKCNLTRLVINNMLVDEHVSLKLGYALKHENCKLNTIQFFLKPPLMLKHLEKSYDERAYFNFCSALVDKKCKLRELQLHGALSMSHDCLSHICDVIKNENCSLSRLTFLQQLFGIMEERLLCVCEALKHVDCKFTELHITPYYIHELLVASKNANAIFIWHFLQSFHFSDMGVISCLCDALKHKDCKLTKLSLIGLSHKALTKKKVEDLQNAITHDNCKLEVLILDFWKGEKVSKVRSRTLEYTCSILSDNGCKFLATKGKTGQYEEIALSSVVFGGKHYIIKIER